MKYIFLSTDNLKQFIFKIPVSIFQFQLFHFFSHSFFNQSKFYLHVYSLMITNQLRMVRVVSPPPQILQVSERCAKTIRNKLEIKNICFQLITASTVAESLSMIHTYIHTYILIFEVIIS